MDSDKGKQPDGADEPDTKTSDKDKTAGDTPFKTPEEVAANDSSGEEGDKATVFGAEVGAVALASKHARKVKHKFKEVGLKLWPSTKKQKIIGGIIAALIIIFGIAAVYAIKNMLSGDGGDPNASVPSSTEPSKLTGVEIDAKKNDRTVIAIMIENSPEARPQSGLRGAGVVFEAIAEGGITRYCALYLEKHPKYVGPVRSVRPYYVDWLAGFDAAVAHAGGSGEGLARVANLKIKDLDYTKANAFWRVDDRFAPHNLYTSLPALNKAAKEKGFKTSKFMGFKRKPELKGKTKTKVKNINFSISDAPYNVSFKYNKKNNSYKRFMGGQPHKDQRSGKFIKPKTVVALISKYSQAGIYSQYKTKGKGKIIVFQDGKAQKGVWKKPGPKKPLQFYDNNGNPLRLNPGQTWITALKSANEASYGP